MALHEEAERRAIEGELADLELLWRDAEEIAGIADSLLLPDDVIASMNRMRTNGDERWSAGLNKYTVIFSHQRGGQPVLSGRDSPLARLLYYVSSPH